MGEQLFQHLFKTFPLYLGFFILGIFSYNIVSELLSTRPYYNNEVHSVEWREDEVDVIASFTKNGDCKLTRFVVVSYSLGLPKQTSYIDNDGLPGHYDRVEGYHTFNITVKVSEDVDSIEIRTRHLCGDEETRVDEVFARLERPSD